MGFRTAEEVTLPTRFLTTTAHFIAVVTILFDVRMLASQILLAGSSDTDLLAADDLMQLTKQLSSVAYAAIACFAVEYVGLFLGVSIFMHGHSCLYIVLHFVGAILTGLMYTNAWSAGALIAFVLVCNCIPAALELLTFLFVARVSYFSY
ncbi:hypothetical protein OEZ85_006660 [Tetradesmus obliquus]|uniref:Transmembrane protein 107 n=1 Tax=Tetradesmus obliquus TaxID=3088 RepID=A0ABY8TW14_TETOB|nr:hypothetical protein OEZ85_006660 [Tetradesmus obliquus]